MMHPLDGIIAKIDRADEHINILNAEIGSFIRDNYGIASKPDDDPSQSIISVVGPEPPLRFAVITGEIVHQLRSSLNHLVCQLFTVNTKRSAGRDLQFPICDTCSLYKRACRRGQIEGISATAADLIEGCQPYHYVERGESIESNKFRILREVDDADKHRLMMIVIPKTGGPDPTELKIGGGTQGDTSPINIVGLSPPKGPQRPTREGTELFRMQFGEPQPDVRVTGKPSIQMAFGDCGPALTVLAEHPVIQVVQQLRDRVAILINSFREEFSC